MSRMDAINDEQKQKESGNFGIERKWYVDSAALEKYGMEQYKAGVGSNFLSIVPPADDNAYFGTRIFVHYNIGPNNDAFLCPRMMLGEPCVICQKQDQLKAMEADEDVVKALSCFPPRYLFIVVDEKSAETADKGPQLYDAPQTVNNEILGLSKNRKTGESVDISDPDNGKMLIFDRVGTKANNTRYSAFELEKRDPLQDDWLKCPDIAELMLFATEEEMLKSLGATVRKKEPEQEPSNPTKGAPEEAPSRRGRRSAPAEDPAPAEETPRSRRSSPAAEEPKPETNEEGGRRRRIPRDEEPPPAADEPSGDDPAPVPDGAEKDIRSRLKDRLNKRRAAQEE